MPEQPPRALVSNRYEIQSRIGEGGMGTVYKAHDALLGITVAIKKLHRDDSPDATIRFQNEAVALGKLNHPNIARILDFANDDGSLYMVMEYLEGRSLSEVIEKEQLSPAEATQIFIEISEGMVHAHKHGVLHRDLKPSNIILAESEEKVIPKIIDFGIAKMRARDQNLTATGVGIGSPLYMSPEQARNLNVDERSDIYSFGCLMFEALTGKAPLRGTTAVETIQKHISERPPRADEVTNTLEAYEDLVEIIDNCLEKEPESRPQSFLQVRDDLVKLNDQSDTLMEASYEVEQSRTTGNRAGSNKQTLILIGALSLVSIGAASAFFLYQQSQSEQDVGKKHKATKHKRFSRMTVAPEFKLTDHMPGTEIGTEPRQRVILNGDSLTWRGPVLKSDFSGFEGNKTIREVAISKSDSTTSGGFQYFKNSPIRKLVIESTNFDDRALVEISELKSLELLSLSRMPKITDKGLLSLKTLSNLKSLDLERCDKLLGSSLPAIKSFPKLEALSFCGEEFGDSIFKNLIEVKNLSHLSFRATTVTPEIMVRLVLQIPSLRALTIHRQPLSNTLMKTLGESKLQSLDLKDSPISQGQLELLSANKNISTLGISATIPSALQKTDPLDTKTYMTLSRLSNLNNLTIYNLQPVPDQSIDAIANLKLRVLKFHECTLSDKQILRLKGMSELEFLEFRGALGITPEGAGLLKRLLDKSWHHNCVVVLQKASKQSEI